MPLLQHEADFKMFIENRDEERAAGVLSVILAERAAVVAKDLGYIKVDSAEVAAALGALGRHIVNKTLRYLDDKPKANLDTTIVSAFVRGETLAGEVVAAFVDRDLDAGRWERFRLPENILKELESDLW